jgi:hypothetical protein
VKLSRRVQAALCAAAIGSTMALTPGPAAAAPGVTPAEVILDLAPGQSTVIAKTVSTPAVPPKADIVFLVDTTGSMDVPVPPSTVAPISDLKQNVPTILRDIAASQPDAQFAVVGYGDLDDPGDPTTDPPIPPSIPFQVVQDLTSDRAAVTAGLNRLAAVGGDDEDEDGINALVRVSTGDVSFRPGGTRIVVLIGDAASHDPSGGHTLGNAISALQAASIRVIALKIGNLDRLGQASAITKATNGELLTGVDPAEVTPVIRQALQSLPVTVTSTLSGCDPNLRVTLTTANPTVTSGGVVGFTETVTVSPDAVPGSTLTCTVQFLLNGTAAPGFTESIVERVPKATPAVASVPSGSVPAGGTVSDSATVTGGFAPTGQVKFLLFGPGDPGCTTPVAARIVPLAGGTASSGDVPVGGAGTYNWLVSYSGDASNNGVVAPCGSEQVVVVKASPTIATLPSGRVPAGGTISDLATVAGGFVPTGTVTFQPFAPTDTTCQTPVTTRTGTLSGGTASSGGIRVGLAGTYRWIAVYTGDANNNPVTSPCGADQVIVIPRR